MALENGNWLTLKHKVRDFNYLTSMLAEIFKNLLYIALTRRKYNLNKSVPIINIL